MIRRIELAAVLVGAIAIVISAHGWVQNRINQQRLQTLLDQKQKAIDAATAEETQTEASLAKTIAEIEELKRQTRSPEDAAKALSRELSRLPVPIQIRSLLTETATSSSSAETPATAASLALEGKSTDRQSGGKLNLTARTQVPTIVDVPAPDLKPLFDSVENCNECQARLDASQSALALEKAKSDALRNQRDNAIAAAKGGTVWNRIGRAAKWIAIGALAGAALSRRL